MPAYSKLSVLLLAGVMSAMYLHVRGAQKDTVCIEDVVGSSHIIRSPAEILTFRHDYVKLKEAALSPLASEQYLAEAAKAVLRGGERLA